MADAFISYSRKDKDFVSTLYAAFERSQKNIWVDWNNIPLTSDWWAEIEKGIEGADTFVFVISPDSIASEICGKEILHAVRNNKRLFPIVRRDATNFEKGNLAHDKISELNWLWFREQDDFEKSFRTLTDSLLLDLEHLHRHTRLVVRANEWDKGRSDSLLLRGDDLASAELWLGESEGKDPQPTELQETYIKKSRDVEAASDRAAAILREAVEKAAVRTKIGSAILAGTILLAGVAGVGAWVSVSESQKQANQAKIDTESAKREKADAEGKALSADEKAKLADEKTQKAAKDLAKTKVEADKAKAEKEKADAEVAKAKEELGKLAEEAEMKLASANAELRQAEASTERSEEARQVALNKIALAEVTLTNVNAKVALLDGDGLKFMLLAVDTGNKLKQIANQSQEWQELKQNAIALLQQANYLLPKQNILQGHTGGATARVWDLQGNQIAELKGHTGFVYSANFSTDGSKIVTASDDKTARLWDLQGNQIAELKGHTGEVYRANFSADGSKIVTASDDKTARVWDLQGNQIAELKGHTGEVYSANFSVDGSKIVTASDDKTARLWDLQGNQIAELKGHTGRITSANFSADSSKIVTASFDKTVRVWDVNGKVIAELKGHTNKIVTASDDNTARVWDVNGNQIAELKGHSGGVTRANFSADDSKIVTTSKYGTARVWEAKFENDLDVLLSRLCEKLSDYLATNPNVSNEERQACQGKR